MKLDQVRSAQAPCLLVFNASMGFSSPCHLYLPWQSLLCTAKFYDPLQPQGLLIELERTAVHELIPPTIPSADYALLSRLGALL